MAAEHEPSLDDIGIIDGTNKSSLWMDYLRHFQSVLEPFRHEEINLIEIGVQTGASLRMWENYFSRAKIVGIDIATTCREHEGGRKVVRIGSQDDPGFLIAVAGIFPPSIVVDDGSHQPEHIMETLHILFPALAPGGVYIIEDLRGHYGTNGEVRRGPDGISPIKELLAWSEALLSGRRPEGASHGLGKYLFNHIDSIQFIGAAAILRKTRPVLKLATKIESVEQTLAGTASGESWGWLAHFILQRGGPISSAEKAARRAVQLEPSVALHHHRLGVVLERMSDRDGALAHARVATEISTGTVAFATYAARLKQLEAAL